jgi:hypothetical protein
VCDLHDLSGLLPGLCSDLLAELPHRPIDLLGLTRELDQEAIDTLGNDPERCMLGFQLGSFGLPVGSTYSLPFGW